MKSSAVYYYLLKSVSLVLLALPFFLLWGVHSGRFAEESPTPLDATFFLRMALSSAVAVCLGYLLWRNLAVVDFSESGLKVRRNRTQEFFSWSDVAKLHQIPFCTPPFYRATFKNGQRPAYFCFFSFIVVSVGFWSWDFRGFMAYARQHLESANRDPSSSANISRPTALF